MTTITGRVSAVAAGALALVIGLAIPALAHVTINPSVAEQGGFTKIAFRVPNERDNADTTKVEVTFPTDNPLPFVSVRPVPGWKVKILNGKLPQPVVMDDGDKVTDSVLKITWSGGAIQPGQFQEFEVSVGPLPKVDSLAFPTDQTYSNGEVVKWADPAKSDGSEAEHPTPTLKLVPATGDETGHAASPAASAAATPAAAPSSTIVAAQPAATSSSSSDGTARLLGAIGIVVGVVGAGVGIAGMRRSRA
ncbi:YcnI family protein [Streptosporangiaceae bacterium NEAU-GS5]|nr:YcnI family protein [Streptosporangiaceae bacterium NEAU-GS5]